MKGATQATGPKRGHRFSQPPSKPKAIRSNLSFFRSADGARSNWIQSIKGRVQDSEKAVKHKGQGVQRLTQEHRNTKPKVTYLGRGARLKSKGPVDPSTGSQGKQALIKQRKRSKSESLIDCSRNFTHVFVLVALCLVHLLCPYSSAD